MDITTIKKLRDETGFGMLEVKKALIDANQDYDLARELLYKQKKQVNTTTRVASKGLTRVATDQNEAILLEINAETDFIVKHPAFVELVDHVTKTLLHSKAASVSQALHTKYEDMTIRDYIDNVAQRVKENVYLRRFHRIKKQDEQTFTTYLHQGGKLSILLITNQDNQINKDLTLHIASFAPRYLSYALLDQETINFEKMMFEKNNIDQNLSFEKSLKSLCLLNQPFVKDESRTVSEIIQDLKIIDFYRFELGQGIEDKLNCRLDIPCNGSKITVTPL